MGAAISHKRRAMRNHPLNRCVIVGFTTAAVILCMTRPTLAQCEAGQITSPKGDRTDGFGGVSLDGDVAVIGGRLALDLLGVVYVYRRGPDGPGDWQLEAVLMSPEPDPEEIFGRAVVSGDVIAVGAAAADAPEFHSGAVYIYRYDRTGPGQWKYEVTLTPSDGDFGDIFGWSMSIDGDVLLVGARDDENDGVPQSGSAYVFRYDPQTTRWNEEAKLTDPEGEELDLFGQSVSIKGDVALVGAHGSDPSGAAFIFRYDGRGWLMEAELTPFDGGADDRFGSSVASRGDVVVVGSPRHDGSNGAAYVFAHDGEAWALGIKLTAADPVGPFPHFGGSSSITGDTILVGAPSDYALGGESGAAYLFRKNGTGWEEVIKLTASDGKAGDRFGLSVAIGGDVAFIGAADQDGPGTVYIFDHDPTPGDLDCDGVVGAADLLALLSMWGPCDDCNGCIADLDGDCIVGASDLLILLANWG